MIFLAFDFITGFWLLPVSRFDTMHNFSVFLLEVKASDNLETRGAFSLKIAHKTLFFQSLSTKFKFPSVCHLRFGFVCLIVKISFMKNCSKIFVSINAIMPFMCNLNIENNS